MPSESRHSRLPPELELLLLCLRIERDPASQQRIRALLAEPLDWDEVCALALSHQVLPFFHQFLQATAPEGAPVSLRSYLDWTTRDFIKKNIRLFAEMLRVLAAFEA